MHRGLPGGNAKLVLILPRPWALPTLGRVLTPLLLGLLRLFLRCRNHLKYGGLSCGCYTYAYKINECSSMMELLYFNWNTPRTVRT